MVPEQCLMMSPEASEEGSDTLQEEAENWEGCVMHFGRRGRRLVFNGSWTQDMLHRCGFLDAETFVILYL